ncbi:hypothetical protein AB0M54_30500 [Actinoplanes sp. NPDC051470]|uniref:hypothetical protein n=1 Tax=Actinoplanes sp. NPDC051470 TaxID=3157224 RepID=UPI003431B5F6
MADEPVIETEIHDRINEALAGRRSQRSFVEQLHDGWAATVAGLDDLAAMVAAADRTAQQEGADAEVRKGFGELRTRPGALRKRAGDVGRQVDAAVARVRRETVNIGVIGSTKVGKSTLLRTITNLPDTVVPSTEFQPTTASASSIYHTSGAPRATLLLHTWESFRDEYLAPLHELAKLGPAPRDVDEFRRHRYPAAGSAEAAGAGADDYLRKLDAAHRSLASYERLLLGGERSISVGFAELRPYVAYPRKDDGDPVGVQPYHAVRSVRIEQPFLAGAATRLGLIDLPGAGEAGLDIDRQFLRQVKNEIDLLLMVKRAVPTSAAYLAEDSYTRTLADSARGGVPLVDYYKVVVNHDRVTDTAGKFFEKTFQSVRETQDERGIEVLGADVTDRGEVLGRLLNPLLRHLAARLAEMDRAVVGEALRGAAEVAGEISAYATAALKRARELEMLLPDQEDEFRTLAEKLRNNLAVDLAGLVQRYDAETASGTADGSLTEAIGTAVGEARAWVRDGLGYGDRAAWLEEVRGQFVHGELETKQDEYYRAKTEITTIFGRIDPSLDEAVQRLWDEVAGTLRARLTAEVVPQGPNALAELLATAESRRARILAGALTSLCDLKEDYGSVVLRVTQPIIRGIHWDQRPAPAADPPSWTPPPRKAAPPVQQAKPGGWVIRPDGSRVRSQGSVVPVAPAGNGPIESLYDELCAVVDRVITALETALKDEARLMTRTLAAAADRFFNTAIRTNRNERDYENLCRPFMRTIWPDHFTGGAARLTADLSRLAEQARRTGELTTAVTGLSTGLRTGH